MAAKPPSDCDCSAASEEVGLALVDEIEEGGLADNKVIDTGWTEDLPLLLKAVLSLEERDESGSIRDVRIELCETNEDANDEAVDRLTLKVELDLLCRVGSPIELESAKGAVASGSDRGEAEVVFVEVVVVVDGTVGEAT